MMWRYLPSIHWPWTHNSCMGKATWKLQKGFNALYFMPLPQHKGTQYRIKGETKVTAELHCPSAWMFFFSASTCFRMRSNIRMKQLRFISSSSQSKSIVFPLGCPKFLKGLWKGLRIGLRNGLWKGLGKGLSMLFWTLRPGSEATLTWRHIK